jgi:hypothetical protein
MRVVVVVHGLDIFPHRNILDRFDRVRKCTHTVMQELYFTIQNKADLMLFSSLHVNINYAYNSCLS